MNSFRTLPLASPLLVAAFCVGMAWAPARSQSLESAGANFINTLAEENRRAFFIYDNRDSHLNHGVPSGLGGSSPEIRDAISLDTGCIARDGLPFGCAPKAATSLVDNDRGTVMRVTFPPMKEKQYGFVTIHEGVDGPSGNGGVGFDVRGADRVVFETKAVDPACRVQIGVGGKSSGSMTLGSAWRTRVVMFADLTNPAHRLSPPEGLSPVDLTNLKQLFAVTAIGDDCPSGGTVLVDRIRLEPNPPARSTVLGLPVSIRTNGVVPVDEQLGEESPVPFPSDQVLANLAGTRDVSVAVLALLSRGEPRDVANARLMLDSLMYAHAHDNAGLPLPQGEGGSRGLRSGYFAGDIASMNDRSSGTRAGDARLAGFSIGWQNTLCGVDRFCLVLDGAFAGDNAWAIVALTAGHNRFRGNSSSAVMYLNTARSIGRWVASTLASTTGFRGFLAGFPDQGAPKEKPLRGKSTSDNAVLFAAFTALADAEEREGDLSTSRWWRSQAQLAAEFVLTMFDQGSGSFNAGSVRLFDAVAENVLPFGPVAGLGENAEVANIYDFVECQLLPVLALGSRPEYRTRTEWKQALEWLMKFHVKRVPWGNDALSGLALTEQPLKGSSGIAAEPTAQFVLAARLGLSAVGAEQAIRQTADTMTKTLQTIASPTGGIPAAVLSPPVFNPYHQCLSSVYQCTPARLALGATAWSVLAGMSVNPLGPLAGAAGR